MSERKKWVRGAATLAVIGAVAGGLMVAPVGAGTGPSAETAAVTAKRVKRIATRVFNKNAPKLRDKCPSGTTRFAGACFETTSRAAASFKAASTTCGNLGRRLPTGSELFGLRLVPGITLAGSTTDAEMTSNLFRDGTFGFMVMEDDGDLYGHQGIFTDLQNPFRCVAPLTNG